MKLKKVTIKKKWRYEYDDLPEMEQHVKSMTAALFKIEYCDYDKLIAIFSQTINEIKSDDNEQGIVLSGA